MIGVGKTKRGRRYPHRREHYECVLCGETYGDEAQAAACFDGHNDTTVDLTKVLHHLFCGGEHCQMAHHCIRPAHRDCCDFLTMHILLGEEQRATAEDQRAHWRSVAERVKRFARTHNIPVLEFVKFIHNLHI